MSTSPFSLVDSIEAARAGTDQSDTFLSPSGPQALALDSPSLFGSVAQPTSFTPGVSELPDGYQWRFAFNLSTCIGCHACEVACGEQNALPDELAWRRVGEIETGSFPATRRFHISMACNHCIEPTCLTGCPANAYEKLSEPLLRGIVVHLDDECIGCQYCTWTCSYQVPVFQPDRRIVTKCDMCKPRLTEGHGPACVEVCPTQALRIEAVATPIWQAELATGTSSAELHGLPDSSITKSTTRIEGAERVDSAARFGDDQFDPEPEHAHGPLVALTVLSQAAVAGSLWSVFDRSTPVIVATAVIAALGLSASLAHLGRPRYAYRAMRNIRRSWLSREAALLGLHGVVAVAAAGVALLDGPATGPLVLAALVIAALVGVCGVYASARLYMLPARPIWNSPLTVIQFGATAVALGSLLAGHAGAGSAGLLASWVIEHVRFREHDGHNTPDAAGSMAKRRSLVAARFVYRQRLARTVRIRTVLSLLAILSALIVGPRWALAFALSSELVGRIIFMRTGIGLNIPGRFNRFNHEPNPSQGA